MTSMRERVRAGAELLDTEWPGWDQRVDPRHLVMTNRLHCVLGQLFGDYYRGVNHLKASYGRDFLPSDYGFYRKARFRYGLGIVGCEIEWYRLRAAWLAEIAARQATGEAAAVEAPELVAV